MIALLLSVLAVAQTAVQRSGWIGDYTCEEGGGAVKGEIRGGVVEKCVSLAPGWGYNKQMENPERIMPLKKVKRLFADCMCVTYASC